MATTWCSRLQMALTRKSSSQASGHQSEHVHHFIGSLSPIYIIPLLLPPPQLLPLQLSFHTSLFPRQQKDEDSAPSTGKVRPLYDIPYMFEAREFMRKKLIGKKVTSPLLLYILFYCCTFCSIVVHSVLLLYILFYCFLLLYIPFYCYTFYCHTFCSVVVHSVLLFHYCAHYFR